MWKREYSCAVELRSKWRTREVRVRGRVMCSVACHHLAVRCMGRRLFGVFIHSSRAVCSTGSRQRVESAAQIRLEVQEGISIVCLGHWEERAGMSQKIVWGPLEGVWVTSWVLSLLVANHLTYGSGSCTQGSYLRLLRKAMEGMTTTVSRGGSNAFTSRWNDRCKACKEFLSETTGVLMGNNLLRRSVSMDINV